MRLLNTRTGEFHWFNDPRRVRYAILSHVWSVQGEQSFQDVQDARKALSRSRRRRGARTSADQAGAEGAGSALQHSQTVESSQLSLLSLKVRDFCVYAREQGYDWAWVDSCCIDKSSSAELSEAVNSMYEWYERAAICYAYLADVGGDDDPWAECSQFRVSRWWTRGWTLQELLAAANVVFVASDWSLLGTKNNLAKAIEEVTGIQQTVLRRWTPLNAVPVAQRMFWASKRVTTRVEDEAYSLMGIFGVKMVTNYGEGRHAFTRLQEEILRRVPDQSLFVWGTRRGSLTPVGFSVDAPTPFLDGLDQPSLSIVQGQNLLASSPRDFSDCSDIDINVYETAGSHIPQAPMEYTMTSYGVRTQMPLILRHSPEEEDGPMKLAVLACSYGYSSWYRKDENELGYRRGRLGLLLVSDLVRGGDVYTIGMRRSEQTSRLYSGNASWCRIIEIPEAFLVYAQRHGLVAIQDVHLLNRNANMQYILSWNPDAVKWTSFNVALPGKWRIRQLEARGYSVQCSTSPAVDPSFPPARHFIISHYRGTTVIISVDICKECATLEGGTPWRAVRISASLSDTTTNRRLPNARASPHGAVISPQSLSDPLHVCNMEDHVESSAWTDGVDTGFRMPGSLSQGGGSGAVFREFTFKDPAAVVWVKMDPPPFEQGVQVGSTFYTIDVEIMQIFGG
ncbi:heterokaryon incompatibility protein-domain-containing protein [Trametes meyenii]|nr:heterokaryon incompatibility protein-domain-containing protein [Trametes meyenii]